MKKILLILLIYAVALLAITGCETTVYPEQFAPRIILDSYLTIGDTITAELTHSESILNTYDSLAAIILDAQVVVTINGAPDTLRYTVETVPTTRIENGDTLHGMQTYRHYKSRLHTVQPNTQYVVTGYLSDGSTIYGTTHSPDVLHFIPDTLATKEGDTVSFGHGYGRPIALKWNNDSLVSTYWMVAVCHDTLQPKLREEQRPGRGPNNDGGRRFEYWTQKASEGIVPWFFFDCQGWYTIKVYNINNEFKNYLFSLTHSLDNVSKIEMNVVGGLGMVTAFGVDSIHVYVTP